MARTTLVFQTVIPDYRLELFRALISRYNDHVQVAAGDRSFAATITTCLGGKELSTPLTNKFTAGGRLLWQCGLAMLAIQADFVIGECCVRSASTWLILAVRALMRRPTVLWGHVSNIENGVGVQRLMVEASAGYIAYTRVQRDRVKRSYPRIPVWSAQNGCMWAKDCYVAKEPLSSLRDILYVGRLVREKKPNLLLEGFVYAVQQKLVPNDSRLLFVGDGPEKCIIAREAENLGVGDRVLLLGHVSSIEQLRCYYRRALVSVSPGYVGLSAVQSFGFGVPMLIARDEPHSPEIDACREGFNCVYFPSNNFREMAIKLGSIFEKSSEWCQRRVPICDDLKANYTLDQMMAAFTSAISNFASNRSSPMTEHLV